MSFLNHAFVRAEERVRQLRHNRVIYARLVDCSQTSRDIIVLNVSKNGVRAYSRKAPKVGAKISIVLDDKSPLPGEVRWVKGQAFGIRLDQQVDIDWLDSLIQQKRAANAEQAKWEVDRLHRVATPAPQPTFLRRV